MEVLADLLWGRRRSGTAWYTMCMAAFELNYHRADITASKCYHLDAPTHSSINLPAFLSCLVDVGPMTWILDDDDWSLAVIAQRCLPGGWRTGRAGTSLRDAIQKFEWNNHGCCGGYQSKCKPASMTHSQIVLLAIPSVPLKQMVPVVGYRSNGLSSQQIIGCLAIISLAPRGRVNKDNQMRNMLDYSSALRCLAPASRRRMARSFPRLAPARIDSDEEDAVVCSAQAESRCSHALCTGRFRLMSAGLHSALRTHAKIDVPWQCFLGTQDSAVTGYRNSGLKWRF